METKNNLQIYGGVHDYPTELVVAHSFVNNEINCSSKLLNTVTTSQILKLPQLKIDLNSHPLHLSPGFSLLTLPASSYISYTVHRNTAKRDFS